MPIEFTDTLLQQNRQDNVRTPSFFHLASSLDIDFSVEKIISPRESTSVSAISGNKYILLGPPSDHASLTVPYADNGDVVIYLGGMWQLYIDVSNPETSAPIIYDKRTEKYYHHTPTHGWIPIVNSKSSLDGGTF
jgi:hypothetical protein